MHKVCCDQIIKQYDIKFYWHVIQSKRKKFTRQDFTQRELHEKKSVFISLNSAPRKMVKFNFKYK